MQHSELQKEIETSVLLAHAIEDSTDIFEISGGGFEPPQTPLGTPLTMETYITLHYIILLISFVRMYYKQQHLY